MIKIATEVVVKVFRFVERWRNARMLLVAGGEVELTLLVDRDRFEASGSYSHIVSVRSDGRDHQVSVSVDIQRPSFEVSTRRMRVGLGPGDFDLDPDGVMRHCCQQLMLANTGNIGMI